MNQAVEGLIVVQTIDSVVTGQELIRIPPHMTVVSWFELESSYISEIADLMDALVAKHGLAMRIAVGKERAMYGVDEDIPVCRIDVATDMAHTTLRNAVDARGGRYYFPQFVEKWSPHISDEHGISVQPGDEIIFSSLALISRHEDERRGKYRIVEYAVPLTEES